MIIAPTISDPRIVAQLMAGGVGVVPTDTIYGIVALASDTNAVQRLYDLKRREGKPGTVIAASHQQLIALGLDPAVVGAVSHLWPNPMSVVIPAGPGLEYLHQGLGDIAARVPADERLRAFLEKTGPLLTSSANHPGEEPASDIAQAQAYFGDEVDFYVDDGARRGVASTVVRYRDGRFETLRPGAITVNENGQII